MVIDLSQAKAEGRTATFGRNNTLVLPINLVIDHASTKLCEAPKGVELLELRMLTRRSTVNPGEVFKLLAVFSSPVSELPKESYIHLKLLIPGAAVYWPLPISDERWPRRYGTHVNERKRPR
jgi:hypothetical protein